MGCIVTKSQYKIIPNTIKSNNHNKSKDDKSTLYNSKIQNLIDSSIHPDMSCIKITNFIMKLDSDVEDSYKTIKHLGKGSFGSVYKVIHIKTGLVRAMKVISKDSVKFQDDEKKFLKEIEILIKLEHPNIIKIYEYYTDDSNYYLITEYVSGGELYEGIVSMSNFNEFKCQYIMNQILSAVHYLHSKGIVHRDIKPENILVSNNNKEMLNIKLIDFGSCNYIKENKNFTLKIGSPYYIAPEVLKHNYNNKCDIWSTGVILYILLVGYPPFKGQNKEELFMKIKSGYFCLQGGEWERISSEAKHLVSLMLEYDYNKRPSAEECLNHQWFKCFQNGNTHNKKLKDSFTESVLLKLASLRVQEKLQQATIAYIVHSLYSSKEIEKLKHAFLDLDMNKDGKLTYKEFKEGFSRHFEGKQLLQEIDFDKLVEGIDGDGDGTISYEEFLRVTVNKKKLLNERNLKIAFDQFDLNKDGKLSKSELKKVLNTSSSEYINRLLETIDDNNDGYVSFEEFKELMNHILTFDIK